MKGGYLAEVLLEELLAIKGPIRCGAYKTVIAEPAAQLAERALRPGFGVVPSDAGRYDQRRGEIERSQFDVGWWPSPPRQRSKRCDSGLGLLQLALHCP